MTDYELLHSKLWNLYHISAFAKRNDTDNIKSKTYHNCITKLILNYELCKILVSSFLFLFNSRCRLAPKLLPLGKAKEKTSLFFCCSLAYS